MSRPKPCRQAYVSAPGSIASRTLAADEAVIWYRPSLVVFFNTHFLHLFVIAYIKLGNKVDHTSLYVD